MLVELKNGDTLNGHLISHDTWMNLVLKEVVKTEAVCVPRVEAVFAMNPRRSTCPVLEYGALRWTWLTRSTGWAEILETTRDICQGQQCTYGPGSVRCRVRDADCLRSNI
jgi:hypothetical protein